MSKEMREQIDRVKNWKQFLNESAEQTPKYIEFKVIDNSDISYQPNKLEEPLTTSFIWDVVNKTYGNTKKNKNVVVLKRKKTLEGFLYTVCRFFIEKNKLSYQILSDLSQDDVERMINGDLSSIKKGGVSGEFENISIGETDDRGWFKIVSVI